MLVQTEFTKAPRASGISMPDWPRVRRTRRKVSWVTSLISSGARSRERSLMASSSPKYETKSRSVSGAEWMSRRTYSASKFLRCTVLAIIQRPRSRFCGAGWQPGLPTLPHNLLIELEGHRDRGHGLHGLAVEKGRLMAPLAHGFQRRLGEPRMHGGVDHLGIERLAGGGDDEAHDDASGDALLFEVRRVDGVDLPDQLGRLHVAADGNANRQGRAGERGGGRRRRQTAGGRSGAADGHGLRDLAERECDEGLHAPASFYQDFRLARGEPAGPHFDGVTPHRNRRKTEFAGGVDRGDLLVLAIQILDADFTPRDPRLAGILDDSSERAGAGLRVQGDQGPGQDRSEERRVGKEGRSRW